MNSTFKIKFGKCPDCPEDSKDKPLTAKRCFHHNEIFKTEKKEKKKQEKKELNLLLGIAEPEPKVIKSIPRFSEKRKKENPIYNRERLRFLAQPENHRCFIEGCGKRADTVEHTMGRKGFADKWARDNNISLFLDVRFWEPCCNDHNLELELNSELSEKYQVSKISGKQKIIKTSLNR